jgi:hypothetical protein
VSLPARFHRHVHYQPLFREISVERLRLMSAPTPEDTGELTTVIVQVTPALLHIARPRISLPRTRPLTNQYILDLGVGIFPRQ